MELDKTLEAIAARLPASPQVEGRFVVAIAGPPAAGKSTLADALIRHLDGRATLLGMDAFHFDNAILDARGDRPRKGAPHTFDVSSYGAWVELLRRNRSVPYALPVYDRSISAARNCAVPASSDHDVLVTEGNYLLLDRSPWSQLQQWFDLTVWLDVDLETVERRIRERWATADLSAVEIDRKTLDNDLPNARLVNNESVEADLTVRTTMHGP